MASRVYEIYVAGLLPEAITTEIRAEFGDGLVTTVEPARTLIAGTLPDQAALIGMLEQLHALGLKVCEVRDASGSQGSGHGLSVTDGSDPGRDG